MSNERQSRRDFFSIVDPNEREAVRQLIANLKSQISYSPHYTDDDFEYRHVKLPKELARYVPRQRLMDETEWRQLGVQQSEGWRHFLIHRPEPHVLLFKRPLNKGAAAVPAVDTQAEEQEN